MERNDSPVFLGTINLTTSEFQHFSELVYSKCGINLEASKKIMLESRLQKRLRVLGMRTFREYIHYISSKEGMEKELVQMIDVVTTNKTDFFREPHHFVFLTQTILPELARQGKNKLSVWSSACSSGEEPYTLAMVLENFTRLNRGFDYSIFASDISSTVLQKAALAVYSTEQANDIPLEEKKRYLLKSKNKVKPTVRIIPELRRKVEFARVNLMDTVLNVDDTFDVIFCRNVLIYFDRETQHNVVCKLSDKLKKGGYLFIGHSESLFQLNLPIVQVQPTIYRKR